ncbi:hypothetical protein ILUMI_21826 [Ignelater luminosus]|uniref:FCP1 homology domain-containing protein n=1 Tax=Ignelater luminosus TaxID=2038154 RepID=A0A8K0CI23_IGNLU|nr:hypothetical protein ILUMI_21826 [Ignelater luminosus]
MSSLVKLTIQWEENEIEININEEATLGDLKKKIHSIIHLEPARQTFFDFPLLETLEDHKITIKELNLRPDCVFIVKDKLSIDKPVKPRLGSRKQSEELKTFVFKIMNKPRDNKKLLVLDIDHTIYDAQAPNAVLGARPYLQDFLQGIYEEYDIAIWSATELAIAEKKLAALNMIENPNYKILFVLDFNAMPKVLLEEGSYYTKPLKIIWEKYQQYSSANTIICDDKPMNFRGDKSNGILIEPYSYVERDTDKELLHLMSYLKLIVKQEDFAALDHKKWKVYKDYSTDSTSDSDNYNYGEGSSGGTDDN